VITHDAIIPFYVPSADKAKYQIAALKAKVSLSAWIRSRLSEAIEREEKKKVTQRESTRSRKPTEVEQYWIDGFKARYGHEPTIDKPCAINLGKFVSKHGLDAIKTKIDAWWECESGNWVKGARTISAFVKCYDSITSEPLSYVQRAIQQSTTASRP